MSGQSIEATVVEQPVVVATVFVGAAGPKGDKGDPGSGAVDQRINAIGETVTNGITGVTIDITGMTASTDYVVQLQYLENPSGNGIPWVERAVDSFVIKHYGNALVAIGYVVLKKAV